MTYTAKTALVTGGAQGIGFEIARKFASEGLEVAITDINQDAGSAAAEKISREAGNSCIFAKMDVSDEKETGVVLSEIQGKMKSIDVLVNNAGICYPNAGICYPNAGFQEISSDEWMYVFQVNVLGVVNCTNAVIGNMKKKCFGRIINMSSSSAFTGGISVSPTYAVSKAGVIALTKSMAKLFGRYNITANALSPGIIETPMTKGLKYDIEGLALKRFGNPKDVASVAGFLASDGAAYLTGATIDINGGLYMR